MTTTGWWVTILVVILLAFGIWWWNGRSDTGMTNTNTTNNTTQSDNSALNANVNANVSTGTDSPDLIPTLLTIQNMAFSPATIKIKKGTTLKWTNKDGTAHTVTSDDMSKVALNSASLAANATYSFKFDTAGTYTYHCSLHPTMKGKVIVTD